MTLFATPAQERAERTAKIKLQKDIKLPHLKYWNYDPCWHHADVGPQPDCEYRLCGGELFNYQRVGVAWCMAALRGLIADDPGLGKTGILLALMALLKERGLLTKRACVVVQTPAVLQWATEAQRWLPKFNIEVGLGDMPRKERISRYAANWDLLVVGYHVAMKDKDLLTKLGPFALFASDDVDPLLHPDTQTHKIIVQMAEDAERSFTINATTLQTQLQQLHAALIPSGGLDVFGTIESFERKYVRYSYVTRYEGNRRVRRKEAVGYKNLLDLKARLAPIHIRRRCEDVDDGSMPLLMPPSVVYLEMSQPQADFYAELQKGALELRHSGKETTYMASKAMFMSGQMICAGLPAIGEPDGPGASPKLDWSMHRLSTVWNDRKVIFFIKNPGLITAFQHRLDLAGIGHAAIIGGQKPLQRQAEQDRFWNDPNCRVIMGTSAIERSLNLQVANTVVAVDTHLNPARMKQILGRGRRRGSKHKHMWMTTLLMDKTQEVGYMKVLSERQALGDAVFEEDSGMYAKLSSQEMLMLITP